MKAKKLLMTYFVIVISLIIVSILLPIFPTSYSYASRDPKRGSISESTLTVEGRFNIRELINADKTIALEYLVMIDEQSGTNETNRYELVFDKELATPVEILGKRVSVTGTLIENDGDAGVQAARTSGKAGNEERKLKVRDLDIKGDAGTPSAAESVAATSGSSRVPAGQIKQAVIPAKYSDISAEPHTKSYYSGKFHTDPIYSLSAYWKDASYGRLSLTGPVTNWVLLPGKEGSYGSYGDRDYAAIAAADPQIDFNGADNVIQNSSPNIGGPGANGDDVDSVIAIYNGGIGGVLGYGYYDPIAISTNEGKSYVYFSAITDGPDSAVGTPSSYFVGIGAHEMGHNFGWQHTPATCGVYCDPWSVMGGGMFAKGPSGPIASEKDRAGWIDPSNVRTVSALPGTSDFTLYVLGSKPGSDFMMAKIPFGKQGHYYTVEARKNVRSDHTPLNQMGLVVYHFSPTGHPGNPEPSSPETIVDTTRTGDLENADIDLGQSYSDAANQITVRSISRTENTITVKVIRGGVQASTECATTATIVGSPANDNLIGTSGADVIDAGGGDDTVNGLGGNDIICGGSGTDTLYGDLGNDIIYGGPGNDTIYGAAGSDTLYGQAGTDTLKGAGGNDSLWGGDGGDNLYGGSGVDELNGELGADTLYGGTGTDEVYGGPDNDTMYGDDGQDSAGNNDLVNGGSGNDIIQGDGGADKLAGSSGNDLIKSVDGVKNNDSLEGGFGTDTCKTDPDQKVSCEV